MAEGDDGISLGARRSLEGSIGTCVSLMGVGEYLGPARILMTAVDDGAAADALAVGLARLIEPAAGPFALLPSQHESAITSWAVEDDGIVVVTVELVCTSARSVVLEIEASPRPGGSTEYPSFVLHVRSIAGRSGPVAATEAVLSDAAARPLDPWIVASRAADADPATLEDDESRVLAVWWVSAEINNGSFDQLVTNSTGAWIPTAIWAARRAGHPLADVLDRGIAPLGQPFPLDHMERWDAVHALDEDTWEAHVEVITDAFHELEAGDGLDAIVRADAEAVLARWELAQLVDP